MSRVTAYNWEDYANTIHHHAMEHMVEGGPIKLGTFRELQFLSNAFQGESGELGNIVKKMERDGRSLELFEKLRGEIPDNRIYLNHICSCLGWNIDELCAAKVRELHVRWPHIDHQPTPDIGRPRLGMRDCE